MYFCLCEIHLSLQNLQILVNEMQALCEKIIRNYPVLLQGLYGLWTSSWREIEGNGARMEKAIDCKFPTQIVIGLYQNPPRKARS